jgi:hypothetical protein
MPEKFGIIITRHMSTTESAMYWMYCIDAVRVHYPNIPIVVIDDNSAPEFLTPALKKEEDALQKKNCRFIYSIYKKRGELLPYYYYSMSNNEWFKYALILHDSVFITRPLHNLDTVFEILAEQGFLFLWHFDSYMYDDKIDEVRLISLLNGGDDILKTVYSDTRCWSGCFGAMAFISFSFLSDLSATYNLPILLGHVQTRKNRMSFERLIGCTMIHAWYKKRITHKLNSETLCGWGYPKGHSYMGSIHTYCPWGIQFKNIVNELNRACYSPKEYLSSETNMPIVKVWSGR